MLLENEFLEETLPTDMGGTNGKTLDQMLDEFRFDFDRDENN